MSLEIPISLPMDGDGFLRRACPACARVFKWHHGPADGAPTDAAPAAEYFCPYCGEAAAPDQWYTDEQIDHIRQVAAAEVMPMIREKLRDAMAPLNRGGLIKAEVSGGEAAHPFPLTDADDMMIVASPCHTYEPIKIAEDWREPVYCLICGQPYVLPLQS